MGKPILSLDFDGVCHSYTSGWKGAANIPDDAVPGLFEFLEQVAPHFDVQIYSSRSNQEGGIEAMMAWFIDQRKKWRASGGQGVEVVSFGFPKEKPSAMIGIDDRILTFDGKWPTVETLKSFKPWNKRPEPPKEYSAFDHEIIDMLREYGVPEREIEGLNRYVQTIIDERDFLETSKPLDLGLGDLPKYES